MDDLIRRQDAIEALCNEVDKKTGGEWLYTDEFCSAINAVPSAEPKRGEWEERPSKDWTSFCRWYCSECGEWQTYGITDFCPNCGADMRGEDDE